ncbi:exonuclease sbcCD subunit D [Aliidiomarina shirensis]|uniref:Nuclease SbcCD subunit D n=1 Tax=Aliidiomarina shirensis TaxID=1048642 RepID=A0A432WXP9_9GAMM|nr:exonuclease SbcCD subunit D [Aliidiomarina shirensis]RUO38570.1 exonuclease sbcCD subunit D [Aliidiomarina shirensis]
MKILHTSDWHLGRYFHQQSLLDDQRFVLAQIEKYVEEQKPDAVIVAGDIYDRSLPPGEAVKLLDDTLHTLVHELKVPVIMISGNHDGADRLGFGARQLRQAGLSIVTSFTEMLNPVVLHDEHGEVAVWCMPYNDPNLVADYLQKEVKGYQHAHELLVAEIEQAKEELGLTKARHILVSHCFLDGGSESDSERPLSIGGADKVSPKTFAGFDYVALGHLHQPQYKSAEYIRYSGSLLKYSFSEHQQNKSVTLVALDEKGFAGFELLPLTAKRNVRRLSGKFEELLADGKQDPQRDDYIEITLTDTDAILEPLARLRAVYPNILDLQKERFSHRLGEGASLAREHLKRTELDMLADFYQQVTDVALSDEQLSLAKDLIRESLKESVNDSSSGSDKA